MGKLHKKFSWTIAFLVLLEVLAPFLLDYYGDPISVILLVHLLPFVLIWLLVKFG